MFRRIRCNFSVNLNGEASLGNRSRALQIPQSAGKPAYMPLRRLLFSALLSASLATVSAARAQDGDAPAEQAAVQPSNAPFMKPLGRLATILGSVHFLRTLCQDPNGVVWRDKMGELLEAQAPNEADRRILVAQFNQGYRAFESTYRRCTPAANLAVERYLAEGARLSREISARYGN